MLLVKNIDTGPCNLYLKLESLNLVDLLKIDRQKYVIQAEKKGLLKKGGTIVEATAGNTGIALAIIAIKEVIRLSLLFPIKRQLKIFHLKALGAEVYYQI